MNIFVTPQTESVFGMLRGNEIIIYLAIENTG